LVVTHSPEKGAIQRPLEVETVDRSRNKPSPRAQAIAVGLARTGRAAKFRGFAGFVRAEGGGAIYWISGDGTRVLRGDTIDSADELQRGFLEAMVKAGSELKPLTSG